MIISIYVKEREKKGLALASASTKVAASGRLAPSMESSREESVRLSFSLPWPPNRVCVKGTACD